MLLTQATFAPAGDRDELADEVDELVAYLRHSGQLWGEAVAGWVDGLHRLMCTVPTRDALAVEHRSPAVLRQQDVVRALCAADPVWTVLDDAAGSTRDWRDESALFMFTHAFDDSSPLNAGASGEPLPLYRLPLGPELRRQLVAWMEAYRRYDRLQLGCGPLEVAAYTQLADPDAALSVDGRNAAREVERATGLPTYYFLHRYWGVEGETDRPCPGCGQPWSVAAVDGNRGLARYAYRCEPCRLISQEFISYDEPERAHIGAWSGPQS